MLTKFFDDEPRRSGATNCRLKTDILIDI